ncbi:hypothetical protein [Amycolatopsis sp. CA-126428]|uniref:hypothetical protein n=1 Tax=Amycolatopsis sp. CA-126428 TaxID=2073158 RepID=UPI001E5ABD8C|nr:hypothetical protein [Amycolatopsis sp. CA-126428]
MSDQLQVNADEFVALFHTVLINVTGFFRDPDAWEMYFNAETQTKILERFHFALAPRGSCSSARPRCCCRTPASSSRWTSSAGSSAKAVNGPVSFAHFVSRGFPQRRTQDISGLEGTPVHRRRAADDQRRAA